MQSSTITISSQNDIGSDMAGNLQYFSLKKIFSSIFFPETCSPTPVSTPQTPIPLTEDISDENVRSVLLSSISSFNKTNLKKTDSVLGK